MLTHKEVLANGHVETALGRKRRFGETLDEAMAEDTYKQKGWHWKIEKCKRQSTNVKIQGTSADQSKKAMVDLFYPARPDGTRCLDREEWLREGYQSQLEKDDIYMILQVHDELVFDAPIGTDMSVYREIAATMCNAIPNDAGVVFKSDIEVSPYWGGKFSPEQIQQIIDGELDWRDVFEGEVKKKLGKFGIEYTTGVFESTDTNDEERTAIHTMAKEGIVYRIIGAVGDAEEEDEEEETEEEDTEDIA